MTRYLLILASIYAITFCQESLAEELAIDGFQRPDGAITAYFGSNFVDPYFATKSLLIAKAEGLSTDNTADAWIKWAIKRQKPDGLFGRYKLNLNGGWDTVSESDADDATLALWLDLVYTAHNAQRIPKSWKESIEKAELQLDKLFDEKAGIYHVSQAMPVGLLMDNSEIYASFVHIAQALKKSGLTKRAALYHEKAEKLRASIINMFGSDKDGVFLVSTQAENGDKFYPDKAAQLFPAMYRLTDEAQSEAIYKKWLKENAHEWMAQETQDYPWGLFAVFSLDMNDIASASCWRSHAEPMRYSNHWNILEEVSLQVVKMHVELSQQAKDVPCARGILS